MIEWLKLENVGPAPQMELDFAPRLNVFTGDNGLGKSFLLDVVWYALTQTWPAERNSKLDVGQMVRPPKGQSGKILYQYCNDSERSKSGSEFSLSNQAWIPLDVAAKSSSLVVYAIANGGVAVYDRMRGNDIAEFVPFKSESERSMWITVHESMPRGLDYRSTVFTFSEAWDGKTAISATPLCNGLIRDWASWQKEKGKNFERLMQVLKAISPLDQKPIQAGKLTRLGLEDVRDMPTIVMPFGQEVPVVHASSGIRRILTFAYLLVWTWQEHLVGCKLKGQEPAREIVFLIDEVEAHLHPRWQQTIMRSLLEVVKSLSDEVRVQLLVTTHAPLVMASLESLFDDKRDAWFDLDFVPDGDPQVQLTKREFRPQGDASNWLKSEAFNLESSGNAEYGELMKHASETLNHGSPSAEEIQLIYAELVQKLPPGDPFLFRWRAIAENKGLLKL